MKPRSLPLARDGSARENEEMDDWSEEAIEQCAQALAENCRQDRHAMITIRAVAAAMKHACKWDDARARLILRATERVKDHA